MRSKRVIAGRGVRGMYALPEYRVADAEDFGGENDTLRPRSRVSWAKHSKRAHT